MKNEHYQLLVFCSLPVVKGEEEIVDTGSDVDPTSATHEG